VQQRQQRQFLLTEADGDAEAVTSRRLALLRNEPLTRPHADGALVMDETGDRKDGTPTAHVGYPYWGALGTRGNGSVAVTSVGGPMSGCPPRCTDGPTRRRHAAWAASSTRQCAPSRSWRAHWCTPRAPPASRAAPWSPTAGTGSIPSAPARCGRRTSPVCWRSSPPRSSGRPRRSPRRRGRRPTAGAGAPATTRGLQAPGRRWGAASISLTGMRRGDVVGGRAAARRGGTYGPDPDRAHRRVVATSAPRPLPQARTGYLLTNLPLPGTTRTRARDHPTVPAADLAEVGRLYGVRQGVEHGDQPVKQELGWADFQVRADRAIRRHWALVCGACALCWWAQSPHTAGSAPPPAPSPPRPQPASRAPQRREREKTQVLSPPGTSPAAPTGSARPRPPSWPRALRQGPGGLAPWRVVQRCWQAWSHAPPPPALQALLDTGTSGQPLYLYLRL